MQTTRRVSTKQKTTKPTPSVSIRVPADVREQFRARQIRGKGGFQSLARLIADRLAHAATLTLTTDELRRIVHYARSYGEGGFQSRLRHLVVEYVHQQL